MRIMPLLLFVLCFAVSAFSQDFTNKGKEFWLGYGNHQQMYAGQNPGMSVYVTADITTNFVVEIGGIAVGSYPINAGQVIEVNIPPSAFLDQEKKYSDRAIHIIAEKPVVAYAHIYYASVSGATLCLPVTTLGREYYSVNFTQVAQATINNTSYSYFFVVATEDNTAVEITPAANTMTMNAGQTYTINLNKGEIFNVLSPTDLTGSTIKSVNNGGGCKRIAVFCGSGRIGIGCGANVSSSDNLVQQMYPTSTWGKKYVTVPSVTRPMNYYRVIRPDATATVKVDGSVISSGAFTNGFYYQFNDGNPHVIESDKPILVAQYFTTQDCAERTNNGDPEMIYLNPVEQTISSVTLTSLRLINQQNNDHYINVVVKNSPAAINTLRIDGVSYSSYFVTHPAEPNYAYAQIPVAIGNHTVTCDTPFNAIAYGFGTTESYGYSAGTNLKDLYQFVSVRNNYSTVNFPASCKNTPFGLYMTFPYQPTMIAWKFGGIFPDEVINNPVYDSSWIVGDRTLYRYKLNNTYTLPAPGTYPIQVLANNPTGDGCNGLQEINYDLEIYDAPTISFTHLHSGCLSDSVTFIGNHSAAERPISEWFWNFGDGIGTSNLQSPKYLYKTPAGSIHIKMWGISDVGCLSDTAEDYIGISPPPVADFAVTSAACKDKEVTFKNNSTLAVGVLTKHYWTFGDGGVLTVDHSNPVTHTYAQTGTYMVTLQVESNLGCKSIIDTQYVTVHVNPEPLIRVPQMCVDDNGAFRDFTSISDGTVSELTYLWSFGDGNTATQKDPVYKYAATGNYTVNMTATSKYGCAASTSESVTVNSSNPQSVFTLNLPAGNQTCAADSIILTDASTIPFGTILHVEIYWDYMNSPLKLNAYNVKPGDTFKHLYPDPGAAGSATYQVRYIVYSGDNCFNESRATIVVKTNPKVQFNALTAVCEEVTPFNVTQASETFGLTGAGIYSGDGINEQGLFDPAKAKAGTHNIRYTYTAANGCASYAEQPIVVYPTPLADAGPDKGVLEGGYVILQGRAKGNNVGVVWTPNISIDNTNIPTPKVFPGNDMTYTLTVSSADGCRATDDVFVKYLPKMHVPNVFSPNGDGVNDTWVIQYLDSYTTCQVDVFNRYGQKVFSSTGYGKPWDGMQQGRPLPIGTYYWIINPKNGKPQLNGSVTIVR